MASDYQRARSPAHKAERRAQILSVARTMLTENCDSSGLSLNELARQAGMAKSNLYRYYESREAILLALLEDATSAWAHEVTQKLAAIDRRRARSTRLKQLSSELTTATGKRPAMCHLMSVLPSVLEHNVSVETVRAFKHHSLELLGHLADAMHRAVPELSPDQHGELLHHAFAFIVGSWPLSHPSAVAREAMADPALGGFRHRFDEDLHRAMLLMARGMLADGEA